MRFLFSQKLEYSHLHVCKCLYYASVIPRSRDKFHKRATACIFVGYLYGQRGYGVYDLKTYKVFISWNVVFYETTFSFQGNTLPQAPAIVTPIPLPFTNLEVQSNETNPLPSPTSSVTENSLDTQMLMTYNSIPLKLIHP